MDDTRITSASDRLLFSGQPFTSNGNFYLPEGVTLGESATDVSTAAPITTITEELLALERRELERSSMYTGADKMSWLDNKSRSNHEEIEDHGKVSSRVGKRIGTMVTKVFAPMASAQEAMNQMDRRGVANQPPKFTVEKNKVERTFSPSKLIASLSGAVHTIKQERLDKKSQGTEQKISGRNRLQTAVEAGALTLAIVTGLVMNGGDTGSKVQTDKTHQETKNNPDMLAKNLEAFRNVPEVQPGKWVPANVLKWKAEVEKTLEDKELRQKLQEKKLPEMVLNLRIASALIYGLSGGDEKVEGPDGRIGVMQLTQAEANEFMPSAIDLKNGPINVFVGLVNFNFRTALVLNTGKYAADDIPGILGAAIKGEGTVDGIGIDPNPARASKLAETVVSFYNDWPKESRGA